MTTLWRYCQGSVSRPGNRSALLGRRSASSQASRRDVALGLVLLPTTASVAKAADTTRLPQGYLTVADKLIHTLEESLDTLSKGGNEAQFRKKADPARDLVRQWVRDWRDDPRVSREESYRQVTAALQELGDFYLAKGQRALPSSELINSLKGKLQAAEASLPKKS